MKRSLSRNILLITLVFFIMDVLCSFSLFSSAEPELIVQVNKTEARIGDRIELEVSVPVSRRVEVEFAERPADVGELSFIGSRSFRTGFLKNARTGRVYELTSYTTGKHVIPPVEVRYRVSEEAEWQSVMSSQVPVQIMSVLDEDADDIRDIKSMLRRVPLFFFVSAILALFAMAFTAVLWWFRKNREKALEAARRKKPAHLIAYEKLSELRAKRLPEKGMVDEYYMKLSEIVRHYIEGRFFLRAPEMTTEEFLESLRASPVLTAEHKELLRDFLSHCDMVKFAKYGPTPLEMLDSFNSAERFVEQTRPDEDEELEDGQ